MILIYSDEKAFAALPQAQLKGRFEAYTAYTKALRDEIGRASCRERV